MSAASLDRLEPGALQAVAAARRNSKRARAPRAGARLPAPAPMRPDAMLSALTTEVMC